MAVVPQHEAAGGARCGGRGVSSGGWQQKVRWWHHTTHHTVLGSTWHMDRVVVVPGNVLMATTTWWWWWWQSMPQTNKKACCEGQANRVCVGTTVAPHTGGASPAHHNTPCRHIHEQQVAHQMPGVCITSPPPPAAVCGHGQGTPHTTIGFHQQRPLCCGLGLVGCLEEAK